MSTGDGDRVRVVGSENGRRPWRASGGMILLAAGLAAGLFLALSGAPSDVQAEVPTTGRSEPHTSIGAIADVEPSDATLLTVATQPPPGPEPVVSALPLDEQIPLRIIAIRPNNPSVAVLDFETRTTTVYPPGAHALPLDATDGAVITPRRELIIWTQGFGRLFTGSLERVDLVLRPDPLRNLPGFAPGLRIVPTPEGHKVWLVQPGIRSPTDNFPTLVELIDIPSGRRVLALEADEDSFPVAATDTGLLLNTETLIDTGEGRVTEPGSERVLHLLETGETVDVGPGRAVAASSTRLIRLVCSAEGVGCELRLSNLDGTDERNVARPLQGEWQPVGGPGIPSDAMPLQTVSPDGSELLIAISQNVDAYSAPDISTVFAVDLRDAATRRIVEFDGPYPLATWSHDGQWIVLFNLDDILLIDATNPAMTIALDDIIPLGHFPLAAG